MIEKLISLFFDKKMVIAKKSKIIVKENRVYNDGYKIFTLNEQNKIRSLNKYFKDLKGLKNKNKIIISSLYSRQEFRQSSRICR